MRAGIPGCIVEAFDINNIANDVYEHNFGHRPFQVPLISFCCLSSTPEKGRDASYKEEKRVCFLYFLFWIAFGLQHKISRHSNRWETRVDEKWTEQRTITLIHNVFPKFDNDKFIFVLQPYLLFNPVLGDHLSPLSNGYLSNYSEGCMQGTINFQGINWFLASFYKNIWKRLLKIFGWF